MPDERQNGGDIFPDNASGDMPATMASDNSINANTHGLTYDPSPSMKQSDGVMSAPAVYAPVSGSGSPIVGALKAIVSTFTVIDLKATDSDRQAMENNIYLLPVLGAVISLVAFLGFMIAAAIIDKIYIAAIIMLVPIILLSSIGNYGSVIRTFGGKNSNGGMGISIIILSFISIYVMIAYYGFDDWNMELNPYVILMMIDAWVFAGAAVAAAFILRKSGGKLNDASIKPLVLTIIVSIVVSMIFYFPYAFTGAMGDLNLGMNAAYYSTKLVMVLLFGFGASYLSAKMGAEMNSDFMKALLEVAVPLICVMSTVFYLATGYT